MSYFFSKNKLSDSEYNDLINSNSLEEIKNYLNNIIKKDENDNSNENLMIIRILSYDEHKKYITSSTLSGSISKNDINVWNNSDMVRYRTFSYEESYNGWNYSEYLRCFRNNTKIRINEILKENDNYDCFFPTGGRVKNSPSYFTQYNSLIQNNNNNNGNVYLIPSVIQFWTSQGGYNNSYYRNDISYIYLTKNQLKYTISFLKTNGNWWFMEFNFVPAFRPVFNYIDNNKSNNIYR